MRVRASPRPSSPFPTVRFLLAHPAHLIACGLGSGLTRLAPGTAGTLLAWVSYPWLRLAYPHDANFALFLLFMALFGVWCIQVTGQHLGEADHSAIVWDEIVPFWLVLFIVPGGWAWQLVAFLAFRFFDIVKPQPARWFDQHMKNGLGVMMDDVVAAGYTLLLLAVIQVLRYRLGFSG